MAAHLSHLPLLGVMLGMVHMSEYKNNLIVLVQNTEYMSRITKPVI